MVTERRGTIACVVAILFGPTFVDALRVHVHVPPWTQSIHSSLMPSALPNSAHAGQRAPPAIDRRRALLGSATAALGSLLPGWPAASASYAMQMAPKESFDTRKAENWKPIATDDTATRQALQDKIDEKRRFRPEDSETGQLTYTKKSAADRFEAGGVDDFELTAATSGKSYQAVPSAK